MHDFSFSIVIASHGDKKWEALAQSRAYPSALKQEVPIYIGHDPDVDRSVVRNRLAEQATSDLLVFLDADDELAPGYIAGMKKAAALNAVQWPFLLSPQVSYVENGIVQKPRFWPKIDIHRGNWMVVGTAVPRDLFFEVGGWRALTSTGMFNEWDDWDLWIRCQLRGARPVAVSDAVYTAHIGPTSIHRAVSHKQKLAWTTEIQQLHWPRGRTR